MDPRRTPPQQRSCEPAGGRERTHAEAALARRNACAHELREIRDTGVINPDRVSYLRATKADLDTEIDELLGVDRKLTLAELMAL